MINKEKINFWNRILKIMVLSFVISIVTVFIVSEKTLEKDLFIYLWFILFFISIVFETIFRIGMVYHSYKLKKYGWMVVNIFLGTIFPIIFFFSILKKEFEKIQIKKPTPKRYKKNV